MFIRGLIYVCRRTRWAVGGIWARAVLRSYGVKFGPGLQAGSAPVIRRHRQAAIQLGSNVTILNELAENPAGISHPSALCAVLPGAELHIGSHVGMSGAILYAWKRISIGDHVFLGADCAVYDSDFHPLDPALRNELDIGSVGVAPVVIESDVWVGARAMILKGVTVGRAAVIGAGAIVTTDVPAGAIVAGVPAKVIGCVSSPREPRQRQKAAESSSADSTRAF